MKRMRRPRNFVGPIIKKYKKSIVNGHFIKTTITDEYRLFLMTRIVIGIKAGKYTLFETLRRLKEVTKGKSEWELHNKENTIEEYNIQKDIILKLMGD